MSKPFNLQDHGRKSYPAARRRWKRLTLKAAFWVVMSSAIPGAPTANAGPNAWVTNQASEDRIWLVDTATNTVVDTVTIEDIPARVALTPDGAFAYVTIVVKDQALLNAGALLRSPVASSPLFRGAYAKLRSADFFADKVVVVDTAENAVVATVRTERPAPFGIAVTPDGASAYVSHLASAVSVIDTATNTVTATVPVQGELTDVAITPDSAFAYVTSTSEDTLVVIDTRTNQVVADIQVGDTPSGITITPNGEYAYVANVLSDTVSVISISANAVVATVPVNGGPAAAAVTPNGQFVYVANQLSNTVSVIATADNTVVSTVTVGDTPIDVAIDPDGNFAYVTNIFSDSLSVIDTSSNLLVDTVSVGLLPEGIAIEALVSIQVTVDVTPGRAHNGINLRSNRKLWVAILSGTELDALDIDADSVRLGRGQARAVRSNLRDVDGNGTTDLLLRFNVRDLAIECGDTAVALSGVTTEGFRIAGEDAIRTVGCPR